MHCLKEVELCLQQLSRNESSLRTLGHVQRTARGVHIDTLVGENPNHSVDHLQILLGDLHIQVSATYFQGELPVHADQEFSTKGVSVVPTAPQSIT